MQYFLQSRHGSIKRKRYQEKLLGIINDGSEQGILVRMEMMMDLFVHMIYCLEGTWRGMKRILRLWWIHTLKLKIWMTWLQI